MLGLPLIEEDSNMRTGIRGYVFDSDATAAYPSATSACNVSKETTKREIIDIQGIEEEVFRAQNLNLVLGKTNALEYVTIMFNAPKPETLIDMFKD